MTYLILFHDAPGHDHIRGEKMPDHLAFLSAHANAITAAGPLFDDEDGAGGAWLVDVDSAEDAWALVKTDPFWPTGLRASVQVMLWRQVFADGKVVAR